MAPFFKEINRDVYFYVQQDLFSVIQSNWPVEYNDCISVEV